MSKNMTRWLIILAIILAVFSAIVFIIPFEHNLVFWVAYSFGVLAIILQIYIFHIALNVAPGRL